MNTTQLIKLLQSVEKGASGRSREISIYSQNKKKHLKKLVLSESDHIEIHSTGDGCSGAEVSLCIVKNEEVEG
jgi:hypothetical protein